MGLKLNLHNH